MSEVCIGMVGTGWAGRMHARSYKHITGVDCRLKTACSLDPDLPDFAAKNNFETYTSDFEELIKDPEIDVVDVITPPDTHIDMLKKALQAGKHVICEKPLTGYFGLPGDPELVGTVSKLKMLEYTLKEMDGLEKVLKASGRQFFYAENWVYSPVLLRAVELIKAKKTKLIQISGITGHRGSSAKYAKYWRSSGGGALSRQGIHPITAALFIKRCEMEARGEPYEVTRLQCDIANITKGLNKSDREFIIADLDDVEDWSNTVITFNDGTKANLVAGDIYLGNWLNRMELYGSDGVCNINMSPNNILDVYFTNQEGIEDAYIMDRSEHNIGWKHALILEEYIKGYIGELQDFLECAVTGRAPLAGFELAKEAVIVIQCGYLSAELGRTVEMKDYI